MTLCENDKCTGCGACFNTCPVNAIRMKENQDGFLHPEIDNNECINCGACTRVCPVLQPKYTNEMPKVYAAMSYDSLREKSSSGGVFSLLAESVLDAGGLVYGAAWDTDFSVKHIAVDNKEDLYKLRGSKYLQSDVNETLRQVKAELQSGKEVLFSGCPCQIAGLYGYLGHTDTGNLLTVEVICHGAPSYKTFKTYLYDNYDVNNIARFEFRDKTFFGWTASANVYCKDGTEFHTSEKDDAYLQAFLPCMSMRNSCQSCEFSKLPRQADISLGDFWGVERYKVELNDGKGTSLVLINNPKGQGYLEAVREKMTVLEELPLEYATFINKTIIHPFRQHPGRKHFYSSLSMKKFNEIVDASLKHHYDIGIVGLWYGINYGSVLTYYALYQVIKKLGYDVVMLPKPNELWEDRFNDPNSLGQKFIWKKCNVFMPYRNSFDYFYVNDLCDGFVLGSDVIWNYEICGKDTDMFFFLDWVESRHKKIAYAASFGNQLSGTWDYVKKAVYYLKRMDAIATREDSGKACLQANGVYDVSHVLDPVFLCDKQEYFDVIDNISVCDNQEYVFSYVLRWDDSVKRLHFIDECAKRLNADTYICGNPNESNAFNVAYDNRLHMELSVEEWLAAISHSKLCIADSYHALCFSLIFHVPFIIIYESAEEGYSVERFRSLMEMLHVQDRFFDSADEAMASLDYMINNSPDWEQIDAILADQKVKSQEWLIDALRIDVKGVTEEQLINDAIQRKKNDVMSRLANENINLREELLRLSKRVDALEEANSETKCSIDGKGLAGIWNRMRKTDKL